LTKIAVRDTASTGDTVRFIITVNNTGTGPADSVWVYDTLPAQFGFVSANPAPTGTDSWYLAPLRWVGRPA